MLSLCFLWASTTFPPPCHLIGQGADLRAEMNDPWARVGWGSSRWCPVRSEHSCTSHHWRRRSWLSLSSYVVGHTQQQTVLPKPLPPSSRRGIHCIRRPALLEKSTCPSGACALCSSEPVRQGGLQALEYKTSETRQSLCSTQFRAICVWWT